MSRPLKTETDERGYRVRGREGAEEENSTRTRPRTGYSTAPHRQHSSDEAGDEAGAVPPVRQGPSSQSSMRTTPVSLLTSDSASLHGGHGGGMPVARHPSSGDANENVGAPRDEAQQNAALILAQSRLSRDFVAARGSTQLSSIDPSSSVSLYQLLLRRALANGATLADIRAATLPSQWANHFLVQSSFQDNPLQHLEALAAYSSNRPGSSLGSHRSLQTSQALGASGMRSFLPNPYLDLPSLLQQQAERRNQLSSLQQLTDVQRMSILQQLRPEQPIDPSNPRSLLQWPSAMLADRAAMPGSPTRETRGSDPTAQAPAPSPVHDRPPVLPAADEIVEGTVIPLAIDEDPNWLSEYHCFVRSDLVEVFWASQQDVTARNTSKPVVLNQTGIRCKYCASVHPGCRASRSSAFPSSIQQIYQSFTMMLRDHFGECSSLPLEVKTRFDKLKHKTEQGASDSKRYWSYAAMKLGMVDSEEGIVINKRSRSAALREPPFGTTPGQARNVSDQGLVLPEDQSLVSKFMYTLMSQARVVRLLPSEQIGNRKSLRVGLPGFGCAYCCKVGRLGLCRMFPARRRTLQIKVDDLLEHLKRCPLCPRETKDELERLGATKEVENSEKLKQFYDRLWERLHAGTRTEAGGV